jgi:F0F1-type ATP synthase assembly protein I
MKQTKAPEKTPSPANKAKGKPAGINKNTIRTIFVGAVLDITWQMAIAVLVPIVGGFELDKALKTTPALTIIGFILAMAGTYLVIRKTLAKYDNTASLSIKGSK